MSLLRVVNWVGGRFFFVIIKLKSILVYLSRCYLSNQFNMTITRGTLVEYWGSRGMPYGDEATGTRADLKALEEQDAHYLSKYGLTLGDIGKVMRSKSGRVYVTWTLSNRDKATSLPMRSSNINLLDDDTWIDEAVDNERDKMVCLLYTSDAADE